jgi:putative ABC transport system permease protein
LRNILVLFQFTVTIGLIACTILVERQLQYVGNADLGFRKDGIVVISNVNNRLGEKASLFKEKIRSHSQVLSASISTGVPPDGGFGDNYTGEGQGDRPFGMSSYAVDEDFVGTLGIDIVQGRGFRKGSQASGSGVILNQAAVTFLGWEKPVGKILTYPGGGNARFEVIGVMKDFNFVTLRSPITPFALFKEGSQGYQTASSSVVVRIAGDDVPGTLRLLESDWKAVSSATPFEYEFLDKSLEAQYESDRRFGSVFLAFSILTILIACIGLLGLVSFSTEQRTKEIGIRKVLGASVSGIVGLLSKEFITLILLANVFAWPAAYLAMNNWLMEFAYRVDIAWWVFALAGGVALVIAQLTVSVQAIRAGLINPVESLRYE